MNRCESCGGETNRLRPILAHSGVSLDVCSGCFGLLQKACWRPLDSSEAKPQFSPQLESRQAFDISNFTAQQGVDHLKQLHTQVHLLRTASTGWLSDFTAVYLEGADFGLQRAIITEDKKVRDQQTKETKSHATTPNT